MACRALDDAANRLSSLTAMPILPCDDYRDHRYYAAS
jgi:hypothetical protein